MSATDTFTSLDDHIRRIKEDCAMQVADARHMMDAAITETVVLRAALEKAAEQRDIAIRTTVKLITQFGTIEAVFADAKRLALLVDAQLENATTPRAAPTAREDVPLEVQTFAPKPEIKLLSSAIETLLQTGK